MASAIIARVVSWVGSYRLLLLILGTQYDLATGELTI